MQEYRERAQTVRAIQVTALTTHAIAAALPNHTVQARHVIGAKATTTFDGITVLHSSGGIVSWFDSGDWLLLFEDGAIIRRHDANFQKEYEPVERPADTIRDAATRHALTEQIAKGLRAEFLLYGGETTTTSRDWRDTNEAVRQQYRTETLERFPYLAPEAE